MSKNGLSIFGSYFLIWTMAERPRGFTLWSAWKYPSLFIVAWPCILGLTGACTDLRAAYSLGGIELCPF